MEAQEKVKGLANIFDGRGAFRNKQHRGRDGSLSAQVEQSRRRIVRYQKPSDAAEAVLRKNPMTPDLKALALAAVEARKTLKWKEIEPALVEFERVATPERILQYRNEVLEEVQGLVWDTVFKGLEQWKQKPHNANWRRQIEGTPIPNDICVNIIEIVQAAIRSLKTPEPK